MKLSNLVFIMTLASAPLMAESSMQIRGGEIVKCKPELSRKVRILNADGSYNYLSSRPGKKFVNVTVKLRKGYSISTNDYALKTGAAEFKASFIAKYGKDFIKDVKVAHAKEKDTSYKLLFEVPKSSDTFDLVFKLKTSITQKPVKGIKLLAK